MASRVSPVVDGVMDDVGGDDGEAALTSVEMYDVDADTWTEVASLDIKRKNVAAAGFGFAQGPLTLCELRKAGC